MIDTDKLVWHLTLRKNETFLEIKRYIKSRKDWGGMYDEGSRFEKDCFEFIEVGCDGYCNEVSTWTFKSADTTNANSASSSLTHFTKKNG